MVLGLCPKRKNHPLCGWIIIGLRPDKTCESVFLDSFLWREYYKIQYLIYQERGVLWRMETDGKAYTSIPTCRQEDMRELLMVMKRFFNEERLFMQ